jgi:hypothetical protein
MMSRFLSRSLLLLLALLCAAAVPAAAQTGAGAARQTASQSQDRVYPGIDVAAGYTFLYDSDRGGAMPAAWLAGLSFEVAPSLSVVAEVDGAYKTKNTSAGKHQYRTHAFMAGVRKDLPATSAYTPFVQALAGVSCYCGSSVQITGDYSRALALQLGGGVDVPLAGPVALRMQADYRHVFGDDVGLNQVRVAVGAVMDLFGRR